MKKRAILYKLRESEHEEWRWIAEWENHGADSCFGLHRLFRCQKEAREWAREDKVILKRVPECDSE
jgi:hypothetical protein